MRWRKYMKKMTLIFLTFFQIMLLSINPVQASSMEDNEANLKVAKSLFAWNTLNLISDANLQKNELKFFFAPRFIVQANGIKNEANYDNYFKFLNHFRKDIHTIHYDFKNFIADSDHVVIRLKAHINFKDNSNKFFDAILILKFNQEHKIILWDELYILIK